MALSPSVKKWVKFSIRWGIAIFGIAYVISNLTLRDHALMTGANGLPRDVVIHVHSAPDGTTDLIVTDPDTGEARSVTPDELLNRPDVKHVTLKETNAHATLLALSLQEDLRGPSRPDYLMVMDPGTQRPRWITPEQVSGGYSVQVPYPKIEIGLNRMFREADPTFLWAAVAIFPLTYLLTSLRWWMLMRALGIGVTPARAFTLNMVGAFYNTFMPGSTGGDVLKAYYAAKQTTQYRTRAVMSVIIDRAIGLLALILLGGTMAAYQWDLPIARRVAVGAGVIIAMVVVGLVVFYTPVLRRVTGLDLILRKLPMQAQVGKAVEAMEIFRAKPLLGLVALVLTFPVHGTAIVSAMLCGMAFGLPLAAVYYFVCVPVIVLAGSIPISPQGAGVMEFFAIHLTRSQGATIGQAFALTMSIRLLGMLWNLTGGLFVLRGGYHAPTDSEAQSVDADLAPRGTAVTSEV